MATTLFELVWTAAVVGIVLKSVATTRYRWLPGVLYLAMAWLIVIAIRPLSLHVPYGGSSCEGVQGQRHRTGINAEAG